MLQYQRQLALQRMSVADPCLSVCLCCSTSGSWRCSGCLSLTAVCLSVCLSVLQYQRQLALQRMSVADRCLSVCLSVLQYQRQLALQRMQEQEREMARRQEQQYMWSYPQYQTPSAPWAGQPPPPPPQTGQYRVTDWSVPGHRLVSTGSQTGQIPVTDWSVTGHRPVGCAVRVTQWQGWGRHRRPIAVRSVCGAVSAGLISSWFAR